MACDAYSLTPSTVWPVQRFPSNLFRGFSSRQLRDAMTAWSFFEQVEAADAATRVRLGNASWAAPGYAPVAPASIWFPLDTEGRKTLYLRGKLLHIQACPGFDFKSQRDLGIPLPPVTNILPGVCPLPAPSGPEITVFRRILVHEPSASSSVDGTGPGSSRGSVVGDH
jgi:hypothetical protein